MTILLELLLQFLGEVLVQIVGASSWHAMGEPFRPAPNRWVAAAGYGVFGLIAGFVSIAIFPEVFVRSRLGRIAMVAVVPIAAAAFTSVAAAWRRGFHPPYRPALFRNAYLLALSMSIVRYFSAA